MTRRREESPLAAFVDQARAIGNGREVWIRALGPESRLLLEDCALLVNDGCVVGLRTRWARRVAVIRSRRSALTMDTKHHCAM